jgi:Uncharacterized conserved protein (DUF2190)
MAWGNFILDSGFDVTAAITKFRCVKLTAAETVGAVTAITDLPVGVAQYSISTAEVPKGKQASVRVLGVSEVEAAGAIAVGVRCQLENDGRVTAEVGASGKRLVGVCVGHPATTAGDRIAMVFLLGLGLA